ncbi:MAG TPA: AraC family transcriptional regulator [Usitatibacteraceae bacterium]|nr:AraC family transcriptional regulator [Usitatibacteraceae bacterium]
MSAITPMLREAGIDPHDLLAEFGLEPAFFEDPENVIPFTTMGRILLRCVERTECEHFGLLVGQHSGVSVLGAVGYLVQSAPDLRTALQKLSAYLHVHDGGAVITLSEDAPLAMLGYAILSDGVEGAEQILDAALAIGFNMLRGLCGPGWQLSGLQFAHARPRNLAPFRMFFGVTPEFDAEQSVLVFEERWLDRALPGADPQLHALMAQRAAELEGATPADLVGLLRRTLKPLVTSADCSLELVARKMGVHERTLGRRLAAEGTSFRKVREDVRLAAACQLLEYTERPAPPVAEILGYSDATAFSRAFRRWSGMAPSKWRASRVRAPASARHRGKAS